MVAVSCDGDGQAVTSTTASPTTSTTAGELGIPPMRERVVTTAAPTTTTTGACTDATTGPSGGDVRAVDDRFEPACVAITAGQGITVRNDGTRTHNVTIEGVGDFGDLPPGEQFASEAFGGEGGPGPGTYRLFCRFHVDVGMEAQLRVAPA
jgi:plastocyanin